jgi:predicted lipoprotein with Yx(FWY)xxD motif
MMRIRTSMIATLVAGALALTACGAEGKSAVDAAKAGLASLKFNSGTAKQHNAPPGTGDFFKGPRNNPAAMKWVELSAGAANGLSPIVHDGAGFTLYRFDKDTASPSKSNCNAACAVTWPPVLVQRGSKIFFTGVPRNAIGVVRRDDGNLQVTLGGWPIYRFSKDTAPGQTNGEGVGGTWFAVSPQGAKVLPVADSASPPAGGDVTLGNGSVILDSGKNFSEPDGSVGAAGPGCRTLGRPFTTLSLQLSGGPIKIWTGPNCTGTSKVISDDVADLPAAGFTQPIASIRFGG